MAQQPLYTLADDGHPQPATNDQYVAWEDQLPDEHRCALGKRLKTDHVGSVTVASIFLMTPIGFHNRKPQLFLTTAFGEGVYTERRYTSLRACLNGHRDEVAAQRRASRMATVPSPSVAPEQEARDDTCSTVNG